MPEGDINLLTLATRQAIDKELQKYPAEQRQSALLVALHLTQEQNNGWLTEELMDAVAEYIGIPKIAVYEVATFYSMYELKPVGRHKICVCDSISCMLNGSRTILEHLHQRLGIGLDETTADGKFTIKEVECLGSCTTAPVCQIGKKYYERLTPEKIDVILNELE